MQRSDVNRYLAEAMSFFKAQKFYLPPFAFWSPEHWESLGAATDYIRQRGLGWDVTDLGSGKFEQIGLILFTLRNGLTGDTSKIFAEKIMMVRKNQRTPFHFHFQKTEDIINRGGGKLVIELYNSDPQGNFTPTDVAVRCDGLKRTVSAGGRVILDPGESITLVPGLYHSFYAADAHTMVGEVSSVNDDTKDNRFYEPLPRFTQINEDERPAFLLCSDYKTYLS